MSKKKNNNGTILTEDLFNASGNTSVETDEKSEVLTEEVEDISELKTDVVEEETTIAEENVETEGSDIVETVEEPKDTEEVKETATVENTPAKPEKVIHNGYSDDEYYTA